ncbi:TMEM175 family protein [Mucilaginibacter sp. dw_454]|uniref:TMEM175 family protein n=1 Tax=Mucilaginibacter sp. dw_454 TaxID=2720079 RepID=UPI002103538C|nr:TMEM175 family protein [Mucilaginibacter sp. dw_454]
MRPINVNMGKGRLEAFSDGVIAIIITIMVLEMKVPHGYELSDLKELWPVFLNYIISFIYVGIYWNNHHHMLHAVRSINGSVLWANTHLLFWLSMVPFVTDWMGESSFSKLWPVVMYGVVLLMNSIAYAILVVVLLKHEGQTSPLAIAVGNDQKGKISIFFYVIGIACAWISPYISFAFYVLVALMWLIPDRRIEKKLAADQHTG